MTTPTDLLRDRLVYLSDDATVNVPAATLRAVVAEVERLRAVAEALESERGNRTSGSLIGLHSVAPLALAALDAWRAGEGK